MTTLARPAKYTRGRHPNTLAALKQYQYKPGENGHGRVYPLKERLYHALDHPLKPPKPDAPHGDVIVYNTLRGAAELVPVAFRETWDRVEGKVPDRNLPNESAVINNFVFILPSGTRVTPRALIEGHNVNSDQNQND